jgi:hypothetical protein
MPIQSIGSEGQADGAVVRAFLILLDQRVAIPSAVAVERRLGIVFPNENKCLQEKSVFKLMFDFTR